MGQFALHNSALVSGRYLRRCCSVYGWFDRYYGWHPCTRTESVVGGTYWDNLRTPGKYGGSLDAYEGPTASSWRSLFPDMGVGSDFRDTAVDSRNISNCVDGFE